METIYSHNESETAFEPAGAAREFAGQWGEFQWLNERRRAIRDFENSPVSDEDVQDLLKEALLAPSSGNSQPFVIHWLRDPALKALAASACRDQRAALTSSTLLVFVSGSRFARDTLSSFNAYVESTSELSEKSRAYHLREAKIRRKFLQIAPSAIWTPIHTLVSSVCPSLTLVPFGSAAVRNWVARNALFAAQTLMLAASARGLDSCPMEGFNPMKLATLLRLKRGDVIPLVIALGRKRSDIRIEPRWRRSFDEAVKVH